jgi:ferric iron reductase protein FhuF
MTETHNEHPLIETLERLHAVVPYLHVEFGQPDDASWFSLADCLTPETGIFTRWMHHISGTRQTKDRPYLGMAMVDNTWLTVMTGLGVLYFAQRVPSLSADNVWYRMNDNSYVDTITLRKPVFYALESDEFAQHPDCIGTVATFDELRAIARREIEQHVAPLIELANAQTKMGKRALWSSVADRCATLIITAQKMMGQAQQADAEVAYFLATGSPLKGKTGVMWVEKGEQCEPFLLRGGCCLSYKLDYGYCRTCPLLSLPERHEKLREVMG